METAIKEAFDKGFRGLGVKRNHAASHVALESFTSFSKTDARYNSPDFTKYGPLVARLMITDAHIKFNGGK